MDGRADRQTDLLYLYREPAFSRDVASYNRALHCIMRTSTVWNCGRSVRLLVSVFGNRHNVSSTHCCTVTIVIFCDFTIRFSITGLQRAGC